MTMDRDDYLSYIKKTFKREDKDDELIDALNDTLYDLTTAYGFQVYQTKTEITLLDNTYAYTYPADYATLISEVRFIDSGNGGRSLVQKSKEDFDKYIPNIEETGNTYQGDPSIYTIYNNEIYFAPYPSTVTGQKVYLSGSTISEELSEGTSEVVFKDRWREIIKFGVLYRAYNDLDMDNLATKYYGLYQSGVVKMKDADKQKENGITFLQADLIGGL